MFSFKKKSVDTTEAASRVRIPRLADNYRPSETTFRRNRTLIGSLSASVRSSNEYNAELKSSRIQAHDLRHYRRRLLSTLFIVMILTGGLLVLVYNFTATPHVRIERLTSSIPLAEKPYEDILQQYYGSHPIERLTFLLDSTALNRYIQAKSPEVAHVAYKGSIGIGVSVFDITVRRPLVSWAINGTKQYVDDSGVVFTKNYSKEPSIEVSDESGAATREGKAIVSSRFLTFIGQAIGAFKMQGLSVDHVIIPSGTTRAVHVSIVGFTFPIKLLVDRGAGEQAEDAARVLRYLVAHPQNIQYLDVRVSQRAFYQ